MHACQVSLLMRLQKLKWCGICIRLDQKTIEQNLETRNGRHIFRKLVFDRASMVLAQLASYMGKN